jgi:membrane-bound lytic murein transglycosylase B
MRRAAIIVAALAALTDTEALAQPPAPASYADRPEVRAFVREMAQRHNFNEKRLLRVFRQLRREEAVLQAIEAPIPEKARSWKGYRDLFVTERRIDAGIAFWQRHLEALDRARRYYGVPEEYIVAIIGVETYFGRNTGGWRVVDALATLAFDYPPREDFFRGELESYLLYARKLRLDVLSVKGSYAGAIGIPQFMPSSYLKYAVDFDGDGVADLRNSAVDAIGSVANFLREHGWAAGEAVQLGARVDGDAYRAYANDGFQPRYALAELEKAGIVPTDAAPAGDMLATLVQLETPDEPDEFRIGLHNFYVLTRYNRSAFYASAVADLAKALRAANP